MGKFFQRNIDSNGRIVRGVMGLSLLLGGGVTAVYLQLWLGIGLLVAGGFILFEAVSGWCVARACGMKTKL